MSLTLAVWVRRPRQTLSEAEDVHAVSVVEVLAQLMCGVSHAARRSMHRLASQCRQDSLRALAVAALTGSVAVNLVEFPAFSAGCTEPDTCMQWCQVGVAIMLDDCFLSESPCMAACGVAWLCAI